jgi:hypothetical protein
MVIDWQLICKNPLTGRKVWIIRESEDYGEFGGDRTWSIVGIQPYYLSKKIHLLGAENLNTRDSYKKLVISIRDRGFKKGSAIRQNKLKKYTYKHMCNRKRLKI